jgi:hypothetical protein
MEGIRISIFGFRIWLRLVPTCQASGKGKQLRSKSEERMKREETEFSESQPEPERELKLNESQSPYKAAVWRKLTPRERLRRSWAMRSRLADPRAIHDRKLFPKP